MDQQELRDLKIIVINGSTAIREQLKNLFDKAEGCEIVGLAANGDEGIQMAQQLRPSMIITDFFIPYAEGIEILRQLRVENEKAIIIIFTLNTSPDLREIDRKSTRLNS